MADRAASVPRQLQLIYLADGEMLRYAPDAAELERFERKLRRAVGGDRAGRRAGVTAGPSPSRLCDWCDHQALCPAFGGTPPPYPEPAESPRSGSEQL